MRLARWAGPTAGDSHQNSSDHRAGYVAATEKRIIEAQRTAVAQSLRPLAQQLTTLLAMLDQFALSMLSHMPEIPEVQRKPALASGQRRHRGWRAEVQETLKQMEPAGPARKKAANENGDRA